MKSFLACFVAVSMSVALVGCKKSDEQKAGDVASDAGDSITSGLDAAAKKVSETADEATKKASETTDEAAKQVSKALEEQTVEAGCAKCIYKMDGVKECTLAIKVADKPYIATGVDVDPHKEGLCEATKKATIAGTVEGAKVALTKFEFEK